MPKAGVKPKPRHRAVDPAPVPAGSAEWAPPETVKQDRDATAEWHRVVPALVELGLMTKVDVAALAGYCMAWSRILTAEAALRKHGLTMETKDGPRARPEVKIARDNWVAVRLFAEEFGFTPSGRARMDPDGPQRPVNPMESSANDKDNAARRFFGY